MKQVADRAGVSRSAVSAALSDRRSTIALSDATRQRIKQIAGEMGYERNILAQSFIKQKSYLLGLLSREEHFVYALQTTKGIEEVLENTDYSLLIFYNGNSVPDQARQLKRSLDRKVDGVIIAPAPEQPNGPHCQRLAQIFQAGLPMVQIYRKMVDTIPVVMTSDFAIGRMATTYLIEQGHRRIAHYTHHKYLDEDQSKLSQDALDRFKGYEAAMQAAGLTPLVVTYQAGAGFLNGYAIGARKEAHKVYDHPARFTAATTFSDHIALGLLKGLQDRGVRVPADFSIMGCDDIEGCGVVDPPLSTLRPASQKIGNEAARLLLEMMRRGPATDVILEPELVIRSSTAPIAH